MRVVWVEQGSSNYLSNAIDALANAATKLIPICSYVDLHPLRLHTFMVLLEIAIRSEETTNL